MRTIRQRLIPRASSQRPVRNENPIRIKFIIKPTEVGKWGLNTAENTGRDGSPLGSASPLADTGVAIEDAPEIKVIRRAYGTATGSISYVNFNAEHVATENATYTLTVGNSINLYNGSGVVSTSGSTYYGAVLYSVEVEVPAHTRYNVPLYTQAVGTHYIGNNTVFAYARVYSCGNDPSKVPAKYYATSNSPSAFCIASHSATKPHGTATANAATTQTYAFDNASKNTKTIRRYFVSIAGGFKHSGSFNKKTFNNYIQLVGEITQQRLVPTSYDVEYDQLRHSLEEEYYEAIRLDENYPTEAVPPRFVPKPCAV